MEINFRRRLSYRVWQGKVSAQSFCSELKMNIIGFESDHRPCLCRFFERVKPDTVISTTNVLSCA